MNYITLLQIKEIHVLKLGMQALLILVVGFILWKVMAAFSRKKSKPKGSSYFDSKYKDKWKNK